MSATQVPLPRELAAGPAPVAVAHVADFYRRYPGEIVTFYTRVEVTPSLSSFCLRVILPAGLSITDYEAIDSRAMPRFAHHDGGNTLIWNVERQAEDPTSYEYRVAARIEPAQSDLVLESHAVLTSGPEDEPSHRATETAAVALSTQGRYLKYLPAIYRDDDFMGRLLMLFESFWAPIEHQIGDMSLYFDPRLAPPEFLPWLASWINLVLDERWPMDKRRRLLRAATALYRRRGTRQGLEEYLEIYTGARPQIVEHRAHNFCLGRGARLGPGIALGRDNEPHTFTVRVDCTHLLRRPQADGDEDLGREQTRRRIEAIIEAEKPAHTGYSLRLEAEEEREGVKHEHHASRFAQNEIRNTKDGLRP
ncbi:MAG: phage tail protein [Anaerolineae bacterium]